MNTLKYVKLTGLLGSIFAAISLAMSGDFATAGGLIAAALASASALKKAE